MGAKSLYKAHCESAKAWELHYYIERSLLVYRKVHALYIYGVVRYSGFSIPALVKYFSLYAENDYGRVFG